MDKVKMERLDSNQEIPYDLLLLADETLEAIHKYLPVSDIYIARHVASANPLAVFVLQSLNHKEMEIKNIAVSPEFQHKGIGSYVIEEIKQIARWQGCSTLWVGTPDSALLQISFYKKNGFSIATVKKDFYLQNYPYPIFENDVELKDMIMLTTKIE
jgi:ribosomal protein S18 acetylase RimI-like enzyme